MSCFYGYGDDNSISQGAFDLLKRTGKHTCCRSLSAGLKRLWQIFSGIQHLRGWFCYSLKKKSKMLSIPAQELGARSGVSFTAQAMASQARVNRIRLWC